MSNPKKQENECCPECFWTNDTVIGCTQELCPCHSQESKREVSKCCGVQPYFTDDNGKLLLKGHKVCSKCGKSFTPEESTVNNNNDYYKATVKECDHKGTDVKILCTKCGWEGCEDCQKLHFSNQNYCLSPQNLQPPIEGKLIPIAEARKMALEDLSEYNGKMEQYMKKEMENTAIYNEKDLAEKIAGAEKSAMLRQRNYDQKLIAEAEKRGEAKKGQAKREFYRMGYEEGRNALLQELKEKIEGLRKEIDVIRYNSGKSTKDYQAEIHEQTLKIGINLALDEVLNMFTNKEKEG